LTGKAHRVSKSVLAIEESRREDCMRFSFRALAAMVVATGTALVGAGAAAGGATTSIVIDRNPIEVSGLNTCSGEEFFLTGESHALLRMTETPSGRTTVTLAGNFLIKGIGLPSGQRYLMMTAGAATIAVVGDTTFVTTHVVSQQIITAGGHNDLYARAIAHITVVDGRATVEFEEVTIHLCK
jgi:hypothetical protein